MSIWLTTVLVSIWRILICGDDSFAELKNRDRTTIEGAAIWLPATVVSTQIDQSVSDQETVQCEILGTKISGVSRCIGSLVSSIDATQGRAEIRCVLEGTIESANTGTNGPAKIKSKTTTSFTAVKIVQFDGFQLTTSPVELESKTTLTITDVDTHLEGTKGILVKRIAMVRAETTKEEVKTVVEEMTKRRLSEKIELEFEKQLSRANLALKVCHRCLVRIGNRELSISTHWRDEENLEVGIVLARRANLP